MRHYTITMMKGFSKFKCPLCRYSVTTRDFNNQNGSCRTQAARVMNEHATAAHWHRRAISPGHTQMWLAH
jgi:transposase-like protein